MLKRDTALHIPTIASVFFNRRTVTAGQIRGFLLVACIISALLCLSISGCSNKKENSSASNADEVRNNALDGSVGQVAGWVSSHWPDAEVVRWGLVKKEKKGYRTRCTVRKKNDQGEDVETVVMFFLDKEGAVTKVEE